MTLDVFSNLPVEALSLGYFEVGRSDLFPDGLIHRKTSPFTILAQATAGKYEVAHTVGSFVAYEGEAFLAKANTPLTIAHHAPAGMFMKARWLHIHAMLFGALDVISLLDLPPVLSASSSAPFGSIIEEMNELQASAVGLPRIVRQQVLAYRALSHLCAVANLRADAKATLDTTQSLLPVLAYVQERLVDPIRVEDLAAQVALSPSRFHAVFKAALGISPMAHVHRQRLAKAWSLIMTTNRSLGSIADATGFCNEFHLSRAFKAAYGYSPSVYKRNIYPGTRSLE